MIRISRLILLALVLCIALAACQQRRSTARVDNEPQPPAETAVSRASLAVAPFGIARDQRQLLAGTLPTGSMTPGPEALSVLDGILQSTLQANPARDLRARNIVTSCINFVHRGLSPTRDEHLQYWRQVGQCAKTQFLLVPVAIHWQDRSGSAGGSSTPARVVLDLSLINVETGALVNHFRYDYQQQALTDNLLEMRSFMQRRGRWVSAEELAREGIERGIRELGL